MEIAVFAIWFVLAVFIAGAADSRGRSAFGWFVISIFLSPLLAVLLLLAFPNVRQERLLIAAAERYQPHEAFEPDGVYGGIPYRVADDGSIEAIMQGSLIRFRDVDRFTGALQP